ncbi:MAG: CPBP family intramembrane metalloprotease [Oscillospiraceae bacterium]|jgi:membrane protease YdiL (CAAX protease family)|nr:CPBP family intramembrane metalloprotease [Oscillospiraceae bacterium]
MNENTQRKILNRFNPFDNPTEYEEYNGDYRKYEPKISLNGYEMEYMPSHSERQALRKNYGRVGMLMIWHMALAALLAFIFTNLIAWLLERELPAFRIEGYMADSSINMALSLVIGTVINLFVFFIGKKITGYKTSEAFFGRNSAEHKNSGILKVPNLKAFDMIKYVFIGGLVMSVCELLISLMSTAFRFNLPDFDVKGNMKLTAVTVIYTCIIAPITEELLFRGLFLKTVSAASQRVGIVISALLFALFHGNLGQAIPAFFIGLFLAEITVKHNSVIPAMLVHFAVNAVSVTVMLLNRYLLWDWTPVYWSLFGIFAAFGVFCLVLYIRGSKRIKTVYKQRSRGFALVFSSPWFVIMTVLCTVMIAVREFI